MFSFFVLHFNYNLEKHGSIVVCISLLVLLMIDQKKKFSPKGITTEFVGEQQTNRDAIGHVLRGENQLVYKSREHSVQSLVPKYASLEEYAQESGRAGQDGLPSIACLLFATSRLSLDATIKEYVTCHAKKGLMRPQTKNEII